MKKASLLVAFLLITTIISSGLPTHALTESTNLLTISDGRLSANKDLQNSIDNYFKLRVQEFDKVKSASTKSSINLISDSSVLASDESNRVSKIDNMQKQHNLSIVHAENSAYVKSAKKISSYSKNQNVVELNVYEWTWLDYKEGNSPNTDRMGYATEHTLTVLNNNNSNKILSDVYDEPVTGASSSLYSNIAETTQSTVTPNSNMQIMTTSTNSRGTVSLNVNKVIDYANTWVIKGNTSSENPAFYNTSKYGYYAGGDCANFVSQCLREGGMADDYGSGKSNSDWSQTQWWFDVNPNPQNNNYNVSPPEWRVVSEFRGYWTNKGYSEVSASSSTIFPGNPVYTSGHVGICVGYNSNGTAIVNAHNADVYHVPYTFLGSGLYTLQLSSSDVTSYSSTPSNPIVFSTPTTTIQSVSSYLYPQENEWFKFTVSTSGYYDMYSTYNTSYNIDTVGYLYQESASSSMYMYELYNDDDSGDGSNFYISRYLGAGTYYVKVRAWSASTSGYFNMKLIKE